MIARYQIPKHLLQHIKTDEADGIVLNTANGPIDVTQRLVYKLNFGSLTNIEPWILDDTPAVISLGQLVMKHGYGFYWHPNQDPYLIDPNGNTIADIQTVGYCPIWEDKRTASGHTTYEQRYGCPAPVIPPKETYGKNDGQTDGTLPTGSEQEPQLRRDQSPKERLR